MGNHHVEPVYSYWRASIQQLHNEAYKDENGGEGGREGAKAVKKLGYIDFMNAKTNLSNLNISKHVAKNNLMA